MGAPGIHLHLRLDLRWVQIHAEARQGRQRELTVLWRDGMREEVLVDCVPLHQVLLDRRQQR
jgi:hypothetical protein